MACWRVGFLCQILQESPALRYLKLSFPNGADHQWKLEEICKQYNQLGGIHRRWRIPGVPSHQEIGDMQRSVTSEIPDYKLVDNPLLGTNSAQADSRAVPEGCN